MTQRVDLDRITVDHGIQPREQIDPDVVEDYRAALAEGAVFPPLVAYDDGHTYWLADGFHRLAANRQAGSIAVLCDVRPGGRRDALLFAAGTNATHGVRRTNADKRRAVERLLSDAEWRAWSDREVGRRCGVAHSFVASVRAELSGRGVQIDEGAEVRKVRRGEVVYEQNVGGVSAANRERTKGDEDEGQEPRSGDAPAAASQVATPVEAEEDAPAKRERRPAPAPSPGVQFGGEGERREDVLVEAGVPEHLRRTWTMLTSQGDALVTALKAARTVWTQTDKELGSIERAGGTPLPGYQLAQLRNAQIGVGATLDELLDLALSIIPAEVCTCDGGCEGCDGTGWLSMAKVRGGREKAGAA